MNHAAATTAEQLAREAIRLFSEMTPKACDLRKKSLGLARLRQLQALCAVEKSARRPRGQPTRQASFPAADLKKGA